MKKKLNYTLFSFLILAIVLQSVPVGFIGVAENGESGNGNIIDRKSEEQ